VENFTTTKGAAMSSSSSGKMPSILLTLSMIFFLNQGIVYSQPAMIPGDANCDGMADIGDMQILKNNYGMCSMDGEPLLWSMGDFNSDGVIDVGDLGILKSNYGTGVEGSVDWDRDYAQVFGGGGTAPVIAEISDTTISGTLENYTGPTPALTQGTTPVTWSLVAGPSGMTINSSTGIVSWTLPGEPASSYTVTIQATNSKGSDEESWKLNVSPKVAAPIFSLNGSCAITISSSTAGASIYYTIDGSEPSNGSNLYTSPLTVNIGTMLKAIAAKEGYEESDVTSMTFTSRAITPPGEGTESSPYLISQLGHLVWMSENVATSTGKHYKMTADIDASATVTWNDTGTDTTILEGFKPIGSIPSFSGDYSNAFSTGFQGIFDANGHIIRELVINRPDMNGVALFGFTRMNSEVRNLGMVGGKVTGCWDVGGLIGDNDRGTLVNAYTSVTVAGVCYVGGLVGMNYEGVISNVYATGAVIGNSDDSINIGGLIGYDYSGTLTNAYATGVITGESEVGGLIGYSDISFVTSSYWNIETSNQITSCYGTGKTTVEMKQQATFVGWDFTNIWTIEEGASYPTLRAFSGNSGTVIPGDANRDGCADISDLQILHSNYGGTGKVWSQGDFNGDGWVEVGDLGILAANYSNRSNWNSDYAQVFGGGGTAPVIAEISDITISGTLGNYTGPTPALTQGTTPVTWSLVAGPEGMTINSSTGVVSWTLPDEPASSYTITIQATNSKGSDEESWVLTVKNPPVIAEIPNVNVLAGSAYTTAPSLTHGMQSVTWSLVAGPDGMTIDAGTGVVTWANPTVDNSPYTITIQATNADGSDEESWTLTVGLAPVIAAIADVSIPGGEENYTGPTPLLREGTTPVTWSLVVGPDGMTINPATGVVSWDSPNEVNSPYTITIRAANTFGSDDESWELAVNEAPIIDEIVDATITEGVAYTGPTPILTRSLPPVAWSLVKGPEGMTINSRTGVVSWPKPAGSNLAHTVIIKATDTNGSDTESWQLTVPLSYTATVVSASPSQAIAGNPVTLSGQATNIATGDPVPGAKVVIKISVKGISQIRQTVCDGSGNFSMVYSPLANEAGRYTVSADHPSSTIEKVDGQFTIYGMQASPSQTPITMLTGGSTSGTVTLNNLGDVNISGVSAIVENVPDGVTVTANVPNVLAASGSAELSYQVISTGTIGVSGTAYIRLTSSEGATAKLPLPITVKEPTAVLTVVSSLPVVTGMVRGDQTLVQLDMKNNGGAPTGSLRVNIPSTNWMSLASASTIDSIAPGETASIVLRLAPSDEATLGYYEGAFVISGTGISVSVPFKFNCVSDEVGDITVKAQDEYTYYADGSPGVLGAAVTLTRSTDGTVAAQGTTDSAGVGSFTGLAEGYYNVKVTADEHGGYSTTCLIKAGKASIVTAFLPCELVTYKWSVTPTEIEDKYVISIKAQYKTDVPAPVVTVEPALVDLNKIDTEKQINFVVTNHGLIAAKNLGLEFESTDDYEITVLADTFGDLDAKSQITVPVRIRNKAAYADSTTATSSDKAVKAYTASASSSCKWPVFRFHYEEECAIATFRVVGVTFINLPGNCSVGVPPVWNIGGFTGSAGSSDTWYYTGHSSTGDPTAFLAPVVQFLEEHSNCNPCLNKLAVCAYDYIPIKQLEIAGDVLSATECVLCANSDNSEECMLDCWLWMGGKLPIIGEVIKFYTKVKCIQEAAVICKEYYSGTDSSAASGSDVITYEVASSTSSEIPSSANNLILYTERLSAFIDVTKEIFGDTMWLETSEEEIEIIKQWFLAFQSDIAEDSDEGKLISDTEKSQLLATAYPSQLSSDDVTTFIDRYNRTRYYWAAGIYSEADVPDGQSTDFIERDNFKSLCETANTASKASEADGYTNVFYGFDTVIQKFQDEMSEPDTEGICASVRIQIDQEAVISTSAFKASLELENHSLDSSLEGVSVVLTITNSEKFVSNDLFSITNPTLTNMSSVDGSGSIAGGTTGKAEWTIVPTDDAALAEPTSYYVSGTLSYVMNDQYVTIPLYPVEITVLPRPKLCLKYFLEQRVYGDDPFTDKVEEAVPFSLGLIMKNSGVGTAKNVRITSSKPEITENQKGLLIDFTLIGTSLNGLDIPSSFAVNLGDIESGDSAVAQWLMTASLQGEFIEYEASYEHVNALGNKESSVFDSIEIHETNHVVLVDDPKDDGMPDFLVNDVADSDDFPDCIHSSNGEVLPVTCVTQATVSGLSNNGSDVYVDMEIPVMPSSGWGYLRITNPVLNMKVVRVTRSDGKEIRLKDNFWTTHRIIRTKDQSPYAEDYLHLVDFGSSGHYRLYYAFTSPPVPSLDIASATTCKLVSVGTAFLDTVPHAVFEETTGQYVGTNGRLQATIYWQPAYNWMNFPIIGLNPQTTYRFKTKALLNGDETSFSEAVEIKTSVTGDINGSGIVDVADLGILAGSYGQADFDPRADLNSDGSVDVGDLGILAANYGKGSDISLNLGVECAKSLSAGVKAETTDDSTTSDSTCNALGVPLIVLLALMSITLVKLEN
jgi:hypothetical protein